jgi:tetratricopeptide (TPR) repeat protein
MASTQLIGREEEKNRLLASLETASQGKGVSIIVNGQPGIGKTTLVDWFCQAAGDKGFTILRGAANPEHGKPFLVISSALEKFTDAPLFEEQEYVSFSQLFAINPAGMLIAKASHQEDELDADIFAGMLTAVQSFVRDSFDSSGTATAGLGRLEYGSMKVMIEHGQHLFLVAVLKEKEHADMARSLKTCLKDLEEEHGHLLDNWTGSMSQVKPIEDCLRNRIQSKFLVKKDLKGVKIEAERLRIANKVFEIFESLTKSNPGLVVLEDLHWADESSLFVFKFLASNIQDSRMILLGTARPATDIQSDSIIEEGLVNSINLEGLDVTNVANIIKAQYSPNNFQPEFAARLHRDCAGNPFFVTELLRNMLDEGIISLFDCKYSLVRDDFQIPSTIEEIIQKRLDVLEPNCITMAEYLSCVGRDADLQTAKSISSLADVSGALNKLSSSGIIRQHAEKVEFCHALFHGTIYNGISPRWKSAHHKSIGEYFEKAYSNNIGDVVYELARHFSITSEKPKAIKYGIMAGEKAEAAYAAEQALSFYRSVQSILKSSPGSPETEERIVELGRRMGELLALSGDYDGALAEYNGVLSAAKEPETRARLHRLISALQTNRGDYDAALASIEAGKVYLADAQCAEMGRLINAIADLHREKGQFDKAIEIAKDALALFERLGGHEDDLAYILNGIGSGYWRKAEYADALHFYGKALAVNEKLGRERGMAVQHTNLGNVYGDQGEFPKCLEHYEKGLKIFEKIGDVRAIAILSNNLGAFYGEVGELEKALGLYENAMTVYKRIGDARMLFSTYTNIGIIYYMYGDLTKAMEHYLKGIEVADSRGTVTYIGSALTNLGIAYLEQGDYALARKFQERAEKVALETGNKNLLVACYVGYASIDLKEERLESARTIALKILELSREMSVRDTESEALRILGVLDYRAGDESSGKANFEAALAVSEGLGLGMVHAQAHLYFGRAMLAIGNTEEAKLQIGMAAEAFDSVSMIRKASESREELEKIK